MMFLAMVFIMSREGINEYTPGATASKAYRLITF